MPMQTPESFLYKLHKLKKPKTTQTPPNKTQTKQKIPTKKKNQTSMIKCGRTQEISFVSGEHNVFFELPK